MNCKDFTNLMIINIYGKLTSEEKSDLTYHLKECSDCSSKFESIKTHENLLDNNEFPKPDWEKSWQIIGKRKI